MIWFARAVLLKITAMVLTKRLALPSVVWILMKYEHALPQLIDIVAIVRLLLIATARITLHAEVYVRFPSMNCRLALQPPTAYVSRVVRNSTAIRNSPDHVIPNVTSLHTNTELALAPWTASACTVRVIRIATASMPSSALLV